MDSRRHKKAGYPLHMKGATDTFSFKPTVITYNEANIRKITEEHSIYLFFEKNSVLLRDCRTDWLFIFFPNS